MLSASRNSLDSPRLQKPLLLGHISFQTPPNAVTGLLGAKPDGSSSYGKQAELPSRNFCRVMYLENYDV